MRDKHGRFVKGSKSRLGVKVSEETKEKQRQAKLNNPVRYWKDKKRPELTGNNSKVWKGDRVGIGALHDWVKRYKKKIGICQKCGTDNAKRTEWANISYEYKRNLNDWIELCTSCHMDMDGHGKNIKKINESKYFFNRWKGGWRLR